MNKVQNKYYFMILTVFLLFVFNYCFFNKIKTNTDSMINQYIIPSTDLSTKSHLQELMAKPYYFRNQIDEVNDLAFKAYKKQLIQKNLLSDKMKNILLLNVKIVMVDNVNFYFLINYIVNISLFISFLFAIFYKEQINNREHSHEHEPLLDI